MSGDPNEGFWLSLSDLARAKGVTKQTVSEKVARLARNSGLRTRPGPRGVKLVDVAQFDRLVGETSDLSKVQAAATVRVLRAGERGEISPGSERGLNPSTLPPLAAPAEPGASRTADAPQPPSAAEESFSEAQKRKTKYEAAIKALDFGERSGQLVAIDDVEIVVARMIEPQLAAIDALALRADEIAAAAARDGVAGVRSALKDAVFKLKATIAASWRDLEALGKERDGSGVAAELELRADGEPQ